MPYSMLQEIHSRSAKNGRSEFARNMISLGLQVEALMKIKNDPNRKSEFDRKLGDILRFDDMEKTMAGWEVEDLQAIIGIANNLKNQKVKQLLIDYT